MYYPRELLQLFPLTFIIFVAHLFEATARSETKSSQIRSTHASDMQKGIRLFKETIRPLLQTHCHACHNQNSKSAHLDVSTYDHFVTGSKTLLKLPSPLLMQRLYHEKIPSIAHKLSVIPKSTMARIIEWVRLGSPFDQPLVPGTSIEKEIPAPQGKVFQPFWSFRPLDPKALPPLLESPWSQNDIDRFILMPLEKIGISPNPPADRHTLIRRATFDLWGLPPTPEQIHSFVENQNPLSYERLVEQLLESSHYGERWARHWMDLVRFAESTGFEHDSDRPNAFHYRDFLIRAFNRDMPYDQFLTWQLAGDEIEPNRPDPLIATGFLGCGVFPTQLTESEFESARYDELDDMITTIGVAFLGLSIGCARCHDHKYDPISTHEYYRFASCFTTTIRSELDLILPPSGELHKVQISSEGLPPIKHSADGRGYPHFYPQTHFLIRGDVSQKTGVAYPGFLKVLMRDDKQNDHWTQSPPPNWTRTAFHRTSLAKWLTDTESGAGHLVARVIVNRLWQHHFGRGLVTTPNDFGSQGARPTHPLLLDWLAQQLIHYNWRLKPIHKLIMLSNTYRQSSDFDQNRESIDPENRFFWRRTPRRLEAEAIRDAMLLVSGLLDKTMYGSGTLDPSMLRRSIYFTVKRSELIPMMKIFDWPEHLVSIGARTITTTAPQALVFMNHPEGRRLCRNFEQRLPKETVAAIHQGYLHALGRPPTQSEVASTESFLSQQTTLYRTLQQSDPDTLARIDFCQALMSMNAFIYID